jgi:hypothetical protein
VQPVVAAYVQEGFGFLALKLQPGQGVQAMRPVSVTTTGAGLSLPLRMVSAGTGPTVSITLWVVGQGRYEAANFPNFTVDPSTLVWDFNTETSNYQTVVQQTESAANFATWQTESSLDLSPYEIESTVLDGDADTDYQAIPADDAGNAGETAEQARTNDLATLFPGSDTSGTVRITRMRADLNQAALASDLTLQASTDQSDLSNVYQVTKSVNAPACPAVPDPCPPCSGSSSGASGSSSSGGVVGSMGGGSKSSSASPGQQSFGCSAAPSDKGGGGWFELTLAGLLGIALVRGRAGQARRKR